jgi:hypothetical protein
MWGLAAGGENRTVNGTASAGASPHPTHTIPIKDFLVADDKQLFDFSLRNQHAIKRTLVGSR